MLKTVIDLLACIAMGVIACVLIWRGRDVGDDDNVEEYVEGEEKQ